MTTRAMVTTLVLLPVIIGAFVGCSTLKPDVHVNDGDRYPLTWNDVREIERLLPLLGISRPIEQISMEGPDRATVRCLMRPLDIERNDNEAIEFTVVRRNSRWVAIGKPSKGRVIFTA